MVDYKSATTKLDTLVQVAMKYGQCFVTELLQLSISHAENITNSHRQMFLLGFQKKNMCIYYTMVNSQVARHFGPKKCKKGCKFGRFYKIGTQMGETDFLNKHT